MQYGGMWYRAAKYDTKQECMDFMGRLKPSLRERREMIGDLVTISFDTPEGNKYVVSIGYPTPEGRIYTESLYERPAVTLTRDELHFAQVAIREHRREQGVSDRQAANWARERLESIEMPEDLTDRVVNDFMGEGSPGDDAQARAILKEKGIPLDFAESMARVLREQGEEAFLQQWDVPEDIRATQHELLELVKKLNVSPRAAGSPGSSPRIAPRVAGSRPGQQVPFLISYRNAQAGIVTGAPDKYDIPKSEATSELERMMSEIIARKLKRSDKYQFTPSAINLLNTVHDPAASAWLSLERNAWIEFSQVLNTPHGEGIRALWVHDMNTEADIHAVCPASREPRLNSLMIERNIVYKPYWSFNVITDECNELFDFTYHVAQERFIYLYSHICPYGECQYPVPETRYTLGECSPCLQCQSALAYWASILHTAIRIVRREFALAPEEPRPFQLAPETYTEETRVTVGKGKNKHQIKKTVTREVDYRLVNFEVSELGYPARALGDDIVAQEEQAAAAAGKRANWLKLAQADAIIWEYREIDTSKGRTLDPARNARWKSYKHVEIAPFKRWVPMLTRERKTIRRVSARRFDAGQQREKKDTRES